MVQRVGVIGAGQMGGGIAEVAAKSGSDVLVWEAKQEALDFGKAKIEKSLSKAVERGKLTQEKSDELLARMLLGSTDDDVADPIGISSWPTAPFVAKCSASISPR